jgi:hypothetical protein
MYEIVPQARSIFTVIEGPEEPDQVTFQGLTLWNSELRPSDIEIISPLFQVINEAARAGDPVLGLVGKTRVDLRSTFDVGGDQIQSSAVIYPDIRSAGQYLVESQFAGKPLASVALQILREGFATATIVAIVAGTCFLAAQFQLLRMAKSGNLKISLTAKPDGEFTASAEMKFDKS